MVGFARKTASVTAVEATEIGTPRTFEEMIASGRFDLIRPGVNPAAFPLDPARYDHRFLQLIGFNGPIDIQQARVRLMNTGLRVAMPEQLLAYLATHRDAHKDYAIAALGMTGLDPRVPPCVMRICRDPDKRILETRPFAGPLKTDERLLVAHDE